MTAPPRTASVVRYLLANARPVDVAMLGVFVGDAASEAALDALAEFQNPDGGFGHGLEPDLQTPHSSAFTTSVAFQYLAAIGPAAVHSRVSREGLRYLFDTFDADECRWLPLGESSPDHPSAPWWDFDTVATWADWGNPSAELLGHLLRFADVDEHAGMIAALAERAYVRLDEIGEPEFHELICFQRLYEGADAAMRQRLWPRLSTLITEAVEHDPANWTGYGATPLTFVDSPDSAFIELFDPAVVDADLRRVVDTLVDGDHWAPIWTWGDAHPESWAAARKDWIGVLTLRNLRVLDAFGLG